MVESSFKQVPLPPLAQLPTVSSQEVDGFFDASTRLEEAAQKKFKNDIEAEATRQGIVDGQQDKLNTDLLYAPTFRGKAYTRAAQKSFLDTVELNATQKMQFIISENPTDSTKARREITGYLNGVLQGFPPAIKERLGQTFLLKSQIKANIGLAKILNRERRNDANQQEVNSLAKDNARSVEIVGNAENLLDPDFRISGKSVAAIVALRAQITSDYGAMIMDEEGTEIAAFNPAFRERALQQFDIDTSNSAIKSAFNQSQDKDEFLRQFKANEMDLLVKDEQGKTVLDLRPNVRRKAALTRYMKAEISRENNKRNVALRVHLGNVRNAVATLEAGGNLDEKTIALLKLRSHQLGHDESFNEVADWVNHSNDMNEMSVMTPGNLVGQVNDARTVIENLRDAGKNISKTDIKQQEAMEGLLDTMSTELNKNPTSWANQVGLVDLDPIIPTTLETVEVNGQQIRPQDLMDKRIADAEATGEYYGLPPVFLLDEERTSFAKFLADKNTSPGAKRLLLESLSGFGDRQDEVLAEIAPQAPEYMHIAGMMSRGSPNFIAEDAIEGLDIIQGLSGGKGQRVLQVNSSAVATIIDKELGVAYQESSQTRKNVVAVAEAIYTTRMFRKGKTDKTDLDEDELITALQEASGANFVDGVQYGGVTTFNERQVVVPTNIKAENFEGFIKHLTDKDWEDGGLGGPPIFPGKSDPVSMTKEMDVHSDLNLINIGDGQYLVARNKPDQDPKIFLAPVDPTSEVGAVQQGFYVLDLNKIPRSQRAKAMTNARTFLAVEPALKQQLETDLATAVEAIQETIPEIVGKAKEIVSPVLDKIDATGEALLEKAKDFVGQGLEKLEQGLEKIDETGEALLDQATEAFQEGKRLFDEFFGGNAPKKVELLIRETEKEAKKLQKDTAAFHKRPSKKKTEAAQSKLDERGLILKEKFEQIKAFLLNGIN